MKTDAETLLQDTLARCAGSIAARLANADAASDYAAHDREMRAAVALLAASARLGDTLARLRGTTHNIRVTREGPPDRGSNGQPDGQANG